MGLTFQLILHHSSMIQGKVARIQLGHLDLQDDVSRDPQMTVHGHVPKRRAQSTKPRAG